MNRHPGESMSVQHTKSRLCPACRQAELQPTTYVRQFRPRGRTISVELLTSKCPTCGAEATNAAQHAENLRRLKARKGQYDSLLLGEEVLALRRRYGITQQQAAKLFGKGKIAFSRYENEVSYPDETATLLFTLAIEKPGVIRWLADRAKVELPLWAAHCEDERKEKLRAIPGVGDVDPQIQRVVRNQLSREPRVPDPDIIWTSQPRRQWTSFVSSNDDKYEPEEATMA